MTKSEKYYEYVYEEFYEAITKHYKSSLIFYTSISDEDITTKFYLKHFIKEFRYQYSWDMINIRNWSLSFTTNYYNPLYRTELYLITKKLFDRLFDEMNLYGNGLDSPYAKWLDINLMRVLGV